MRAPFLDSRRRRGDTQRVQDEGIVVEVHGMLVTLMTPSGERVRARPPRDRTTPVIGDRAKLQREGSDIRVVALAPRERVFSKPNAQGGQIVAAHVDRLVIVTAVEPGPRPGLVDRMCIALDSPAVEVVLVVNKADLPDAERAAAELDDHVAVGARRVLTSTRTAAGHSDGPAEASPFSTGLEGLRALLAEGLSLVVGHSGVGKSSIVNALVPGAALLVGAVNDVTAKGRHTTTVATCHVLGPERLIVDTPGVRAFPLDGLPLDVIAARFPGFAEPSTRCHFARCLHQDEPGCAVRAEAPAVRLARWDALLAALREERDAKEFKKGPPPRRR